MKLDVQEGGTNRYVAQLFSTAKLKAKLNYSQNIVKQPIVINFYQMKKTIKTHALLIIGLIKEQLLTFHVEYESKSIN